jgi:hypothetical protein
MIITVRVTDSQINAVNWMCGPTPAADAGEQPPDVDTVRWLIYRIW